MAESPKVFLSNTSRQQPNRGYYGAHSSAIYLWTELWGRYHVPQNVFLVINNKKQIKIIIINIKIALDKYNLKLTTTTTTQSSQRHCLESHQTSTDPCSQGASQLDATGQQTPWRHYTLLSWAKGKQLAWNVTVPDTYAESHIANRGNMRQGRQLTRQHNRKSQSMPA